MICPRCQYDWKDLTKHVKGDDCDLNQTLRVRQRIHPELLLCVATPFESLIEEAGLETWRTQQDPYNLYCFVWAVRICMATWLQGNRVWVLRAVARSLSLQVALSKKRSVNGLLYKIVLRHIK